MTKVGVEASAARTTAQFGFWVGLATGTATLITFVLALATPPRSGSLCEGYCVVYPYLDIAARFPRDYFWMFPAILATLLYFALATGLHGRAAPQARPFTRLGVGISAMATLTLAGDYFVQIAVIQPSILAGESDGVSLLTQYNPHGLFIALEEFGYLLMSASLVCLIPAFSRATLLERSIRRILLGGFVLNIGGLCWVAARYGHTRGYLFELLVISVDWLVLVAGSFMAAAVFRRDLAATRTSGAPAGEGSRQEARP